MPDLSFIIKASNEAGGALSELRSQLGGVKGEAGEGGSGGAAGALGGLTNHLGALATAAGGVGAAFEAKQFLGDSVDAVTNLAGEVKKLQVVIGGTPEDASRLKFAFGEMGVNADEADRSLGKFSKGLEGLMENEDGTTTKSSALIDKLKGMGVEATDSAGKQKPMTEILAQLADKFKDMPNGAEKTALAMQLFGKAGVDLIPFLNKGAEGLQDLYKESDKFGLTLSGNTIGQVKEMTLAHKQFDAAMEGVKVQIGIALLPLMVKMAEGATQIATTINQYLVPAIKVAADWLNTNWTPQIAKFVQQLQDIVSWVQQHWTEISGLLSGPLEIAKALIIGQFDLIKDTFKGAFQFIGDLLAVFKDLFSGNWSKLWTDVKALLSDAWNNIKQLIGDQLTAIEGVLSGAWDMISGATSKAWGEITGLVTDALHGLWQWVQDHWVDVIGTMLLGPFYLFRDQIGGVLQAAGTAIGDGLKAGINLGIDAINSFISAIDAIQIHIPSIGVGPIHTPGFDWGGLSIPRIPRLAGGTDNWPGGLALVGEQGPELAFLAAGSSVIPAGKTAGLLGRLGGVPGFQGGLNQNAAQVVAWAYAHAKELGMDPMVLAKTLLASGFYESGLADVPESSGGGGQGPFQFTGGTYNAAVAAGFDPHTVAGSLGAFAHSGDMQLGIAAYVQAKQMGADESTAMHAFYLAMERPNADVDAARVASGDWAGAVNFAQGQATEPGSAAGTAAAAAQTSVPAVQAAAAALPNIAGALGDIADAAHRAADAASRIAGLHPASVGGGVGGGAAGNPGPLSDLPGALGELAPGHLGDLTRGGEQPGAFYPIMQAYQQLLAMFPHLSSDQIWAALGGMTPGPMDAGRLQQAITRLSTTRPSAVPGGLGAPLGAGTGAPSGGGGLSGTGTAADAYLPRISADVHSAAVDLERVYTYQTGGAQGLLMQIAGNTGAAVTILQAIVSVLGQQQTSLGAGFGGVDELLRQIDLALLRGGGLGLTGTGAAA